MASENAVESLNNRIKRLLEAPRVTRGDDGAMTGLVSGLEKTILKLASRPISARGARIWYSQDYLTEGDQLRIGVGESYVAGDPLDYMTEAELADLTELIEKLEERMKRRAAGDYSIKKKEAKPQQQPDWYDK